MTDNILDYCGGVFGASRHGGQKPFGLPGDTPHYARDRLVDVQHIKLDIDVDIENKRIEGVARTMFRPINDGLSHVEFDAVEMEIESVRIQGRRTAARYSYDGAKLRIELGRGRKTGERITTVVRYSASPRRGLYFVAPDEGYPDKPLQVWSQGQDEDSRHWFPCVDFPNEMATSELAVTVPKPMIAVCNGRLLRVTERGRKRTYRWRQDQPHVAYLVSLAAGDFAEISERVDGLPVQYYVPRGREADGKRALARTPRMLRFFSERIGIKYPYAKYAQVIVSDFIFGGMENVSATTLTENILHDRRAHPDIFDAGDGLVAHELAHQWFGDLLTCRDWAHGWLNEGFATYFDALFTEHQRGVDEFRLQMRRNGQVYMGEDARRYRRPIVSNTYTEPIDLFDRQFYEKGSWALHMLRYQLGDDLFWKAIRHYAAKHRGGNVTTPDLQRAIEESTGRNLDEFFDQWLYGAGHPQLTVAFEYDSSAKQGKLTVTQTQSADHGSREVFRTPVDVSFAIGRGEQSFRIQLTEREQSFYFPLPSRPKMVRFDPGGWLLKALEFQRDPEMLTYQLKNDDDVLGRIDAAANLAKLATAEAVAALKAAVQNDAFWGVQAEAARALGTINTPEAQEALIDCLDAGHARARRAVVAALGSFRDEPPDHRGAKAAAALQRLLDDGDASYYVEAEAAAALGKTRSDRAFATLERTLEKESHNNVIRVRAFEGFSELRDERALPIAMEWTAYGKPYQARDAAATCLSKLARFIDRKEPARDRLIELLDDPWLRTRLTAVAGLVHLGESEAIPALEQRAARELDGRVIRSCREAAARLREGVDKGEEVKKLREELDKLREDQRTLTDRLAKMEAKPKRKKS
ncbi:MAG: HEAT repeat domain-containing protein [Chloroflexi bacterium]|nr:HEAT repeat domain-containing protein [Chloroflexota bacterium]